MALRRDPSPNARKGYHSDHPRVYDRLLHHRLDDPRRYGDSA